MEKRTVPAGGQSLRLRAGQEQVSCTGDKRDVVWLVQVWQIGVVRREKLVGLSD